MPQVVVTEKHMSPCYVDDLHNLERSGHSSPNSPLRPFSIPIDCGSSAGLHIYVGRTSAPNTSVNAIEWMSSVFALDQSMSYLDSPGYFAELKEVIPNEYRVQTLEAGRVKELVLPCQRLWNLDTSGYCIPLLPNPYTESGSANTANTRPVGRCGKLPSETIP